MISTRPSYRTKSRKSRNSRRLRPMLMVLEDRFAPATLAGAIVDSAPSLFSGPAAVTPASATFDVAPIGFFHSFSRIGFSGGEETIHETRPPLPPPVMPPLTMEALPSLPEPMAFPIPAAAVPMTETPLPDAPLPDAPIIVPIRLAPQTSPRVNEISPPSPPAVRVEPPALQPIIAPDEMPIKTTEEAQPARPRSVVAVAGLVAAFSLMYVHERDNKSIDLLAMDPERQ